MIVRIVRYTSRQRQVVISPVADKEQHSLVYDIVIPAVSHAEVISVAKCNLI